MDKTNSIVTYMQCSSVCFHHPKDQYAPLLHRCD